MKPEAYISTEIRERQRHKGPKAVRDTPHTLNPKSPVTLNPVGAPVLFLGLLLGLALNPKP